MSLTPAQFEQFCATQFRLEGWSANLTAVTGDQGADVVAEKGDIRVVVQCKLHSKAVGNAAVQEVAAARSYYGADFAVVVSRSGFTRSAVALAARTSVKLMRDDQVRDWAHAHRLKDAGTGLDKIEDVIVALNVHGYRVSRHPRGLYKLSTPSGIKHVSGDGALRQIAEELLGIPPSLGKSN